jgi:predicted O-linked N-acetylglucosamine transferase (SPINDLY family)
VPLPELDYLFCDSFVIPPDLAPLYTPKPLYIGEFYQANDSKRQKPVLRGRADFGLPDDGFVFCCFSNHYKITQELFAAWMDILRQVDHSVLWLVADNQWSCGNLVAAAKRSGIDPNRIVFAGRTSPTEYLAYLDAADLFLDTYPYNAGTIASDVIRMRLPLLTITGQCFASRMAGRLLTAVGAQDGIAANIPQYIEKAVALATDRERYDAYRTHFTEGAWEQAIGNIGQFTREFEQTLASLVPGAAGSGAD